MRASLDHQGLDSFPVVTIRSMRHIRFIEHECSYRDNISDSYTQSRTGPLEHEYRPDRHHDVR